MEKLNKNIMKISVISSTLLILMSFNSCKKNYDCKCDKTSIYLNDADQLETMEEKDIDRPIEAESSKSKAEESCESFSWKIDGEAGTSEEAKCTLR